MTENALSFNLWREPWIQATTAGGALEELSIAGVLQRAGELRLIHEASPLGAAGIQRLLIAIAHAITVPREAADVGNLLEAGGFDPAAVDAFGEVYGDHFDLFSPVRPFMQTADIPLSPRKEDRVKTVAYLAPEVPAGTEITHWRHGSDRDQAFCPRCCAVGLAVVPAFATSGGAGIKPSINGVPPLYLLPVGESLFEGLALSLVSPAFQPEVASPEDHPWWETDSIVPRSEEVLSVGYLESLTFPARRIRLFPTSRRGACSRCGREADVLVASMVFDMGLSRPKGAAFWFDPFAAYRTRAEGPVPVRPAPNKPAWRDYSALFLAGPQTTVEYRRPSVVDQVDQLVQDLYLDEDRVLSFRAVGMRTDMKAKIFEWTDSVLRLPAGLLRNPAAAEAVVRDSQYADVAARDMGGIFGSTFDPDAHGNYRSVRERMAASYWSNLEAAFRRFVQAMAAGEETARREWVEAIIRSARSALQAAADEIGDRGEDLARQAQAQLKLNARLKKRREEWLDERAAA